eukprot:NODE_17104_length_961_cov_7.336930.p6 GENE.NODE_17104_length_961_cov_7.336930~~NODE_17104_length_961_cov_7.336930.p6  ORF type:complete len:70 (+),score=14.26 NODE_17104_length_961_cov_7.336930:718-927(+)
MLALSKASPAAPVPSGTRAVAKDGGPFGRFHRRSFATAFSLFDLPPHHVTGWKKKKKKKKIQGETPLHK